MTGGVKGHHVGLSANPLYPGLALPLLTMAIGCMQMLPVRGHERPAVVV